jgi:hypothetical protein
MLRLDSVDDISVAAQAGDFAEADQRADEFFDYLSVIRADLKWGEGPGHPIQLTTPPDVLGRVFRRIHAIAIGERAELATDWAESRQDEERNRLVVEACEAVLADIPDECTS